MTQCGLKRGFFTLRVCENNSIETCVQCSRPFCVEHSGMGLENSGEASPAAGILCLECAVNAPIGTRRLRDDEDHWLFDLRRWFRDEQHHAPHDLTKKFSPDAEKSFDRKASDKGIGEGLEDDKSWDKMDPDSKSDDAKTGFADS